MSTLPAKRKCQKSHCSLVSSVASAPQFRYRMRLSGLRALCFDTASISAEPTLEPVQCITNGMFWSVMFFSAISASAGCSLSSNGTSSNLRPSAPPAAFFRAMMNWKTFRNSSPPEANGPENGSV